MNVIREKLLSDTASTTQTSEPARKNKRSPSPSPKPPMVRPQKSSPAAKCFVNYLRELDAGTSDENSLVEVSNSEFPPTKLAVLFYENAEV